MGFFLWNEAKNNGTLLLDVYGIEDSECFLVAMLLNIEVSFLLVFAAVLWVGLWQ